jgi:hypothetical protein
MHTKVAVLIAEADNLNTHEGSRIIAEAGVLAERINLARFEETMPDADHTTRLCETLDIVMGILTEWDAIQKEAQKCISWLPQANTATKGEKP